MRDKEIWAQVMEKYPKLAKEATCASERYFRNMARKARYDKLIKLKLQQHAKIDHLPN